MHNFQTVLSEGWINKIKWKAEGKKSKGKKHSLN